MGTDAHNRCLPQFPYCGYTLLGTLSNPQRGGTFALYTFQKLISKLNKRETSGNISVINQDSLSRWINKFNKLPLCRHNQLISQQLVGAVFKSIVIHVQQINLILLLFNSQQLQIHYVVHTRGDTVQYKPRGLEPALTLSQSSPQWPKSMKAVASAGGLCYP